MKFFWPNPLPESALFLAQTFYPNGNSGIWADFPPFCHLPPAHQLPLDTTRSYLPRICSRVDTPSLSEWQTLVLDARQKIFQGHFQKVVLARQTTLTFDSPINPNFLLQTLLPLQINATLFMIQPNPSTAFLGASPEKLFIRKDQTLWTEAVAGTIAQDETWSSKEHSEFNLILPHLEKQLLPFCTTLRWEKPQERNFGTIRHLSQRLEGKLHSPTPDATLIAALHPTPALGGFPSKAALDYLRSVEPFDRGLYGAPIGLVSETHADISVAIRSMLIRGKKLYLFAGAGIVLQSCPLKEWEELDRKVAHILCCKN